jgi:hypothetical protein
MLAVVLLVGVASLGSAERSWRKTLLVALALAVVSSLIFVVGLSVPVRLLP